MSGRLLIGVVLVWTLCSDLHAQAPRPWPEPEVCNEALLADYQRREELIFDLMMYLHECRERFHGCEPNSYWTLEESRRLWLEAHPEIERRQRFERERRDLDMREALEEMEQEAEEEQ